MSYFDVDGLSGSILYRFDEVDDDVVGCDCSSSFSAAASTLESELLLFSPDSIAFTINLMLVFYLYHKFRNLKSK